MIIKGNKHIDVRGILCYNNNFDASLIKRIYTIENANIDFIRGWQGHKIEQRWFAAVTGSFEISVVQIDDWDNPSKNLPITKHILNTDSLDYLNVPQGHITAIQALEYNSKLLIMTDYLLGELQDDYRYPVAYFEK